MEFPPYPRRLNPEPFPTLSMEEFNRLSTDERAAYLRRAMEHLKLLPKQGPLPD